MWVIGGVFGVLFRCYVLIMEKLILEKLMSIEKIVHVKLLPVHWVLRPITDLEYAELMDMEL